MLKLKINNYLASLGKIFQVVKHKICILRSLYFDKKFCFDEATNQIDSESEQIILNKTIISKSKIVIFVSHNKI